MEFKPRAGRLYNKPDRIEKILINLLEKQEKPISFSKLFETAFREEDLRSKKIFQKYVYVLKEKGFIKITSTGRKFADDRVRKLIELKEEYKEISKDIRYLRIYLRLFLLKKFSEVLGYKKHPDKEAEDWLYRKYNMFFIRNNRRENDFCNSVYKSFKESEEKILNMINNRILKMSVIIRKNKTKTYFLWEYVDLIVYFYDIFLRMINIIDKELYKDIKKEIIQKYSLSIYDRIPLSTLFRKIPKNLDKKYRDMYKGFLEEAKVFIK